MMPMRWCEEKRVFLGASCNAKAVGFSGNFNNASGECVTAGVGLS
jgi:hypothetical protein